MKTTIAYKKHGAGVLYIVLTVLGVLLLITGIALDHPEFVIFGLLLAVICAVLSIQYLSLPSEIIVLCDDDTILLPKGVTLKLEELVDVSYRRASARAIQYRWGSVTLSTRLGSYKFGFVADCEEVAKTLTKLMYEAKNNDN